jgi:Flp pilus assembly protein TadB
VTLLAALAIGSCCFLLTGRLVGRPVDFAPWPRTHVSSQRARQWLAQAGAAVSPAQFVLGSVGVGVAVFAVTSFVTGAPLVAILPAVVATLVPRTYFSRRRVARLRALQAAWPDGLRELRASIAAGASLSHALTALSETGPPVLREACSRFPTLARMLGPVAALEVIKAEQADPTTDRVIEVLILAQERGGPIVSSILDDLVAATTKDVKLLDEIESQGLEMKINARAVLVLPWLVLVALTLRGGAFRDFYESAAGLVVVGIGAVLSALGAWWIGHLGRAQEEPRVFGAPSVAEIS